MSEGTQEIALSQAPGQDSWMVEEGAAWFKKLYNESVLNELISTESEKIALLIHAFMCELNFHNLNGEDKASIPSNWRSPAGFLTKYTLGGKTETSIFLTVTSMGNFVKVHGTNTVTKETFSSSNIKPSIFVGKDPGCTNLTNVGLLARSFKNEVGTPLLNSARRQLGLAVCGLGGLPPELLLRILRHLDLRSLVAAARVSSQIHAVYKLNVIWRNLYLKDFGSRSLERRQVVNREDDWYRHYKEEFVHVKEAQRARAEPSRPPMFPFPDFSTDPGFPDPSMPPVPGILGGDYDRFPGGLGSGGLGPGGLRLPRPRFDPPGPNFPQFGPRRGGGGGFGGPPGFGGGFGGFM